MRLHFVALLTVIAASLVLGSCGTSLVSDPLTEKERGASPEGPTSGPDIGAAPGRSSSLRGDPGFDPTQLSSVQRAHYDRLWQEINDPDNHHAIMLLAASDDLHTYGRALHGYVQSVLTAFRVTGDLALLDHVDNIAQRMRQELRDGWRNTLDRTDGTRDGYLNWVERSDSTSTHHGKDLMQANDMKTHALVAMIAYALHNNRDLTSPNGNDYAAHADFWHNYLVNHFEAKWRQRRDIHSGFPIAIRPFTHTYYSWTKWHYYMWKLTGDDAYGNEANRMANALWSDIRSVSTPNGPTYVWPRGVLAEGNDHNYLHPTGYANNVYGDFVTFHLEGFHNWASNDHMQTFARTFTTFVMDTDDPLRNGFAADIGGASPKAGYHVDPHWPRRSASAFINYQYALISPWDTTHRIADITQNIQNAYTDRDTTRLAAALLLNSHLNPTTH